MFVAEIDSWSLYFVHIVLVVCNSSHNIVSLGYIFQFSWVVFLVPRDLCAPSSQGRFPSMGLYDRVSENNNIALKKIHCAGAFHMRGGLILQHWREGGRGGPVRNILRCCQRILWGRCMYAAARPQPPTTKALFFSAAQGHYTVFKGSSEYLLSEYFASALYILLAGKIYLCLSPQLGTLWSHLMHKESLCWSSMSAAAVVWGKAMPAHIL